MPAFTSTVLVLDQASGAAQTDDDRVVGIQLHPDAAHWLDVQSAADAVTVLALPITDLATSAATSLAADDANGAAAQLARAVGASRVTTLPTDLAASSALGVAGDEQAPAAFVCADRALRGQARQAGYLPAAHPAVLPLLANADALVGARFVGARSALERFAAKHGVIPMHLQPIEGSVDWALIGLCTPAAITDGVLRRLGVGPLAFDPAVDDLVWVRIDEASEPTRSGLAGRRILFAEPGQVLIALGPDESSEALALHGAHGHTELLAPDPGLLQPARSDTVLDTADGAFAGPSPIVEEVVVNETARRLIKTTRRRCSMVTRGYAERLDCYTGTAPLDAAGPIVSRHIAHPDNKRVEAQLLGDLRAMGYCPWRHDFLHNAVTHSNVIADLPGNGRYRIKPVLLERIRRLLTGDDGERDKVLAELDAVGDHAEASLRELPEPELRRELERIVALEPWNPWWKLKCPMAGLGAGLVIVGAHLDSTAGFDPGYSPPTHPAPGRDDNGSGLAAVLTLAQHFRQLAGKLTHTVRFCFFNAEEAGLVGSKAFASQLKAQRAPVRAVFCMDMIGYNSDSTRIFELHAGCTDPAVRDLSVPLATQVAAAAAANSWLLPAQVYSGTGYSGAPDRTIFDGAINRSDHAAFQQQGWGAVLASEDFFANLPAEPAPDANPNYHSSADQTTDVSFARAITCAVGRAATLAAL